MTMLHTPPDAFQSANHSQQSHSSARMAQVPRSHIFNGNSGGMPYRGMASTPAYAFQSTPTLRQEVRTPSAPLFRQHPGQAAMISNHAAYPSSSSASTASSSSSNPSHKGHYTLSKDDSVLAMPRQQAGFTSSLVASSSTPDLLMRSYDAPAKPSPDRYRRIQRRADSSPTIPTLQNIESQRHSLVIPPEQLSKQGAFLGGEAPIHRRAGSADDSVIGRPEGISRYRRRSVGAFEPGTFSGVMAAPAPAPPQPTTVRSWAQVVAGPAPGPIARPSNNLNLHRPNSFHQQQQNIDASKRPSSARQDSNKQPQPSRPMTSPAPSPSRQDQRAPSASSRGSIESTKRLTTPSPLSKPVTAEPDSPKESPSAVKAPASPKPSTPEGSSPAVQQLQTISENQPKKAKSRLRRAFSFGSSHELKKSSGEATTASERAKLRKEKHEDEHDEDEAAIIAKQEAAGLGASIYSNQQFAGSTDNVSFSSTASSASLMLRKMGAGIKKSTRSLKGLFRPKSVVGVPAADGPVASEASTAEVSLVTVEAETHKVNVNADPHDHAGGGTGFPKLERNSMENSSRTGTPERPGSSQGNNDSWSRRSIIGGERERAEVLAAVRKGILKRMDTRKQQYHIPLTQSCRLRNWLRQFFACCWPF